MVSVGEWTTAPATGAVIATVGADLSIFTVTDADARLPALSTAVPVTVVLPSTETGVNAGAHVATPLSASSHLKYTVALSRFHPPLVGGGPTRPTIVGRSLSTPTTRSVKPFSGALRN